MTNRSITVVLPYPPSANRYKSMRIVTPKGGKQFISTFVTKEAEAFKNEVGWRVREAGLRSLIRGRVAIAFTLHPNRPQDWERRARKLGDAWEDTVQCLDLDNAQKVLLDALNGIAFEDDKWVREISATRGKPDGQARLVVTITQLETPAAVDDDPPMPTSLFDSLEA